MAGRDSSVGLGFALAIVLLGGLAAVVFFAPLVSCSTGGGDGWVVPMAGHLGRTMTYPPVRCKDCGGKGRWTLASLWLTPK